MTKILLYFLILQTVVTPDRTEKIRSSELRSSEGKVTFISDAPNELIKSENTSVRSVINIKTGEIAVAVPIASFKFKKKLMKKHFNEQYLESDLYPQSSFEGKLKYPDKITLNEENSNIPVSGKIKIHGVEKEIECIVDFTLEGNALHSNTSFVINLEDYNIKVPKMFLKKISRQVMVEVDLKYTMGL